MALKDAPQLLTDRLDLRLPTPADFPLIMEIVEHAQTARFLGRRSGAPDHFMRFCRGAGSWLLYGYGMFIIRLRGSEEVIGNCGVFHSWRGLGEDFDDSPEAGWTLRHDQVGRGIGKEAMAAALEWFDRQHGPRRVVCMISPANEPSQRLADRLGFAAMCDAVLPDGEAVRLFERVPGTAG
jgi:RimJ/RimL family protein N-acetyltransferase